MFSDAFWGCVDWCRYHCRGGRDSLVSRAEDATWARPSQELRPHMTGVFQISRACSIRITGIRRRSVIRQERLDCRASSARSDWMGRSAQSSGCDARCADSAVLMAVVQRPVRAAALVDRAAADAIFRKELISWLPKCDELGLEAQRDLSRAWYCSRPGAGIISFCRRNRTRPSLPPTRSGWWNSGTANLRSARAAGRAAVRSG